MAKHKFDVAILLENQKDKTKKFSNTPSGCREFAALLSRFGDCHICMEATGSYSTELATYLADNNYHIPSAWCECPVITPKSSISEHRKVDRLKERRISQL
ncbi:IS110 family transposase [Serratia silvae]|uniref:Transposase n=1 Tax=Serratia silvae TaxID=2824122 RepID=A0ABT0K699_9GAMM|nr:transposase [Serratia silvae]